jgi:hypothetical protein
MLRHLIGRQVLVGQLGAYEGVRLVRGSDSPAPSQRGQVQPLIVVARAVLVGEEGGSPHVRRVSEDQEGLVPRFRSLEGAQLERALAPLSLGVDEDHPVQDELVTVAAVDPALVFHDGEAAVLGGPHRTDSRREGDESDGEERQEAEDGEARGVLGNPP